MCTRDTCARVFIYIYYIVIIYINTLNINANNYQLAVTTFIDTLLCCLLSFDFALSVYLLATDYICTLLTYLLHALRYICSRLQPFTPVTYYLIYIYSVRSLLTTVYSCYFTPKRSTDRFRPFYPICLCFNGLYRGRAPLNTTQDSSAAQKRSYIFF